MKLCRRWTSLQKLRKLLVVLLSLIVVLMLHEIFSAKEYSPDKAINRANLTMYELFEPEVLEDFPTDVSGKRLIPHIIHQRNKDGAIPKGLEPYVNSFRTQNPSWKYFLWTDESARRLIAEHHPSFLPVWDNYDKLNRAYTFRYFVLYEYGGIYAELGVECHRPLDRVTSKYAAIFPPEPAEHSLRLHIPFLLGNAIMLSRPKHPFLKQIIDSLSNFQPMTDKFDATGPSFVTTQFMIYNKFNPGDAYKLRIQGETNSPYFYKGELREDDINAVYVPNTHYFMHTINYAGLDKQYYDNLCETNYDRNDAIVRRGCNEYWLRTTKEKPSRFTFTEHHWR